MATRDQLAESQVTRNAGPTGPSRVAGANPPGKPIIVAKALGGRVELYTDRIRIVRNGMINYLLCFLGGRLPVVDSVFPLERVSGVEVVRPILCNNYMTLTYPGSPPQVGRVLIDATAENAIFLNFFDNRRINRLIQLTRDLISPPLEVRIADSDGQQPISEQLENNGS